MRAWGCGTDTHHTSGVSEAELCHKQKRYMNAQELLKKINHSYRYHEYSELVQRLGAEGKTSGTEQKEAQLAATKLNAQRMKRLDKTAVIPEALCAKLGGLHRRWIWVLLTEAWCGDGAQNIPYIGKLAACSPQIDLRLILRDEHPEIMDQFLTNGTRSVPKLVCIDAEKMLILGSWGPRSKEIQDRVLQFKKEHPAVPHEEFLENLHGWYAKDKGAALFASLEPLLTEWMAHI
ncbi:MAG: thioredoxin family protein [Bacteroidia bacterium]|nr:thioredoxin family protein [Bacteroidia bacterium]